MKTITFLLLILIIIPQANAAFIIQHSFFYNSDEDDVEDFTYSRMNNLLFMGASLNRNQTFFLGQSVHLISKSHQASSSSEESSLSLTELGPRLIYFLDIERTWSFSLTYNPYARGNRTIDGTEEDISGSSIIGGFGYQLKLTKTLRLGASLNYYMMSVSSKTVSNTKTEVSESYSTIIPMIDFALQFR